MSELADEAKQRMQKSLESFQHELTTIRTGRAAPGLLEGLEVEVYGQSMKLNQLATISAPEARMLTVQPWDKSQMNVIEKAIKSSPLDLNPNNDGNIIRVPLPPLSEERRKELVKMVGRMAEEARVAIRNIRRHVLDEVKKEQKDGDLPEDDAHRISDEIQKVTDDFVHKIDEALKHKEEEIMEV